MTDQKTRFLYATLTGIIAAFVLGGGAGLMTGSPVGVIVFGSGAALCALLSIHMIWVRAMRKRENRTRGFWYGVLTGLIAFLIMMIITAYAIFLPDAQKTSAGKNEILQVLVFSPLLTIMAGFIFGGFLSLPAGGLLGYLYSRNPENSELSSES